MRLLYDFVRDASHDLKTPLSSILLKINILEHASEQDRAGLHQDLKERAMHLANLIEDLFTLSRIESDTGQSYTRLDVHDLIRQVIGDTDQLVKQKSLELVIDLGDETCEVSGVREQLYRLLSNLMQNAIRYSRPEGRITIQTAVESADCIIRISDTGVGIEPESLPHIFDRFYRGNMARRSNSEGTGLGLAISRAIVGRHNGDIRVESTPGKGSIFEIRIPATDGPADPPADPYRQADLPG